MGKLNLDHMLTDLELGDEGVHEAPPITNADPADLADEISSNTDPQEHEPDEPQADRFELPADAVHPGASPSEQSLVDLYDPTADDPDSPAQGLAELLLAGGIADQRQITSAQTIVTTSPQATLTSVLLDEGVEEIPLMEAIAKSHGLEFERVDIEGDLSEAFDGTLIQRLGIDLCKKHEILPLRSETHRIVLGTSRPEDVFALDDARLKLKARSIRVVVIPGSDIRAALDILDDSTAEDLDVDEILGDIEEDDVQIDEGADDDVDLEREAAESPVIRYVNYIIQTAIKEGASDIHIEPGEKTLKVRFRIDGVLFEMMQPPGKMGAAITSRLKIMANLDIAERRVPQDGRIRCTVNGRKLDLRVSTLPSAHGEKTVMRILDQKSINVGLDDLGFSPNALEVWKGQINQPHGIVLVTGPTGSGKTTTLYASLREMDKKTKNISTVEDPIEYQVDGITQTQTHEKIGMSFSMALKALLRQDPDIIMIGEIRDFDTAHTAVQAALTGHLVLSTLHTNDAPSSVTRLVNIGIEPFLIGAAVNTALAQRLVRRICQNCKREAKISEEHREFLEMRGMSANSVFEGEGCSKCRSTGHQGRLGIYELLVIDDTLRDIVARNPNVTEFRKTCCERGMTTLRDDGLDKVSKGQTTIEEVLRVTELGM